MLERIAEISIDIGHADLDKINESPYAQLLTEFIQEFVGFFRQHGNTVGILVAGISDDGNINIRTGNSAAKNTPITIRIENKGATKNVAESPVSDCTGIVVGIHAGNLFDGGNSYADILDCQQPDLAGLQTYDLIEEPRGTYKGGRWTCFRLRSKQDFQTIFVTNQIRNVA